MCECFNESFISLYIPGQLDPFHAFLENRKFYDYDKIDEEKNKFTYFFNFM